MTSPRFNENLDIRYILIDTCYNNNNRALAKKDCCKIIEDVMDEFSKCNLEKPEPKITFPIDTNTLKLDGEVHIIPSHEDIRLLYIHHSGYTWIKHKDGYIYTNNNSREYINEIIQKFNNTVNSSGCFVFELADNNIIEFRNILFNFVVPLTKMNFCGCLHHCTLYNITYYKDIKTIKFEFDTESG